MSHTPLDINRLVDRYVERKVRSFMVGWVLAMVLWIAFEIWMRS